MAKDFDKLSRDIVHLVGGEENVLSLTHCITRLRFKLKDESLAKTKDLTATDGVLKVMQSAGQYQVVIGTDVNDVFDKIMENFNIRSNGAVDDKVAAAEDAALESGEKKKIGDVFVDLISGIFMPFMGVFSASGLLKGILVLLTTTGILSSESTTYTILYATADGIFYFMPFFLAYSAGNKFGVKPFVSMAIAAAMLYPQISTLQSSGTPVTFLGIPVQLVSYSSSVLPIVIAVFAQSKLEKLLNKVIPKMIRNLFVPLITLVIVVPLSFIVIGPVTTTIGNVLASAIQTLLDVAPAVGGFLIAALFPVMILFGVHWGLIPIIMNNHSTLGYDMIMPLTVGGTFGTVAACFAVFLRTKNSELKEVAGSAGISCLVGGVSEPALYGVILKSKKLFIASCLINGIGGIIGGITHMTRASMISVNLLTLPAVIALYGPMSIICIAISFVGTFLVTYLYLYKDVEAKS